jgi:hypothetical protein
MTRNDRSFPARNLFKGNHKNGTGFILASHNIADCQLYAVIYSYEPTAIVKKTYKGFLFSFLVSIYNHNLFIVPSFFDIHLPRPKTQPPCCGSTKLDYYNVLLNLISLFSFALLKSALPTSRATLKARQPPAPFANVPA